MPAKATLISPLRAVRLLALGCACLATIAYAASPPRSAQPEPSRGIVSRQRPVVHRITEDVWAVSGFYHSGGPLAEVSAGIIFTSRSVIFIDAGMTVASGDFLWNLAQERARGKKPYLILTHYHSDHVFGMRAFVDRGATVIAHAGTAAELKDDNGSYKAFILKMDGLSQAEGDRIYGDVLLTVPDRTITHDETLTIDGEEIRLLCVPGHVPDEIAVYHPRSRTLFAGDAVYEDRPHTRFGGPKEWRQWMVQLERIKLLRPKVIVAGHGGVLGPEVIDTNVRYLQELLDQPRPAPETHEPAP